MYSYVLLIISTPKDEQGLLIFWILIQPASVRTDTSQIVFGSQFQVSKA